ncbi:MAG TPA: hypothetical protein VG099_24090 [Gemmataceae bacterium]|jgi:hypothetical protein|nr:hypothetical protein [Gemmataceae bacterium]
MSAAEDKQVKATATPALLELAPPDYVDPVIEAYKKDVDRTLLRENLKLSVDERFRQFESFMRYVYELREAGRQARELRK